MVNKNRWQYGATITIRLEKSLREKLCQEAEARSISLSEAIRHRLMVKSFEELFAELTPQHRARIERFSQRSSKSIADIMQQTIRFSLPYHLDNANCGF